MNYEAFFLVKVGIKCANKSQYIYRNLFDYYCSCMFKLKKKNRIIVCNKSV